MSAPFLTSLLHYYSGFHFLFQCILAFLQNSKFSLCTFLNFHVLKYFYCYRCFSFYFGSLQLLILEIYAPFQISLRVKWSNSHRRFGTTCRSRLSNSQTVYLSTQRNIPEERRSHLHRGRSLKSRVFISALQTVFVFRLVPSVPLCLMPHTRLIPIFFYNTLSV